MLKYSDDGLAARPAFFASYNDITIIVEDTGKESFYTQILNRLLGGKLRIYKVIGVGGKEQVFRRFERSGGKSLAREFYLVDGDFDELLGRACPGSNRFYRLHRYDMESFLIEEHPICIIAEEESPRTNAVEFRDLLQIQSWETEAVNAAVRLAACAALLQELDDRRIEISQSIEQYVSGNKTIPDKAMIESQIAQVRETQSVVEHEEFDRLLEQMVARMGASNRERRRWISGKNILVPLMTRLLRQHTGRNVEKESLCFRLAKNCEFSELAVLRDLILAVA